MKETVLDPLYYDKTEDKVSDNVDYKVSSKSSSRDKVSFDEWSKIDPVDRVHSSVCDVLVVTVWQDIDL